jgi:hypothetical protein
MACRVCNIAIPSEYLIICAGCNLNGHSKCEFSVNISANSVKHLMQLEGVKWFCKDCENSFKIVQERINIKNEAATKIVEQEINNQFGDDFETIIPTARNPRIRIAGVYGKNIDNIKICDVIKNMNEEICEENDFLKVIKVEESRKNSNYSNLIVEVEAKLYRKIMNVGKLKIGWSMCNVYDSIYVRRCFKCSRFNHQSNDCGNDTICPYCAKQHSISVCKSKYPKCINCIRANEKQNGKFDVNHAAWSFDCPVYKQKIEQKKKQIRYE